ncbi:FAD-dependent oxidoreductase [uncultured Jatrophihabitans sp.]|uniref:FAD-dependent oxidoreductase n=1 Tax=uncultured Jatrophihabitans sp. TaxID=1610747 RepID=UPI0035CBF359
MASDGPVVIVGAGLAGAAAARSIARRGHPVVVLEQFAPGHAHGSSHGSARIVRRAYGDALYTSLTGRAFELWSSVPSPEPLLRMLGALDFGPDRDVAAVAGHLAAAGVAHEVLPAIEAERRWPGMRFEGDVVFHPQAGTLDADAAVRALLADAVAHGADVRFGAAARALLGEGEHARVTLADGFDLRASRVVVAAGAWVAGLLDGALPLPALTVTQQQVFHFPRLDPSAPPWPSVIHEHGRAIYHLAGGRDGGPLDDRKLGEHDGGPVVRPGVTVEPDAAVRERVVDYVRRWLPGLDPTPRGEATCLYTTTPSEDFVLDRVGPVVVCSPCSGHGAKFAPLIGEFVADLVDGRDDAVPARFGLSAHARGLGGSVSL